MLVGKFVLAVVIMITAFVGINWYTHELIAGVATVIDGDTIEIGHRRIRLFGIDAPESRQTCSYAERDWPCGQRARELLTDYVGRSTLTCRDRGRASYGRAIAVCYRNGTQDVGAYMVEQGMAIAETQFSNDYVDHQHRARARLRGIWSSTFELPRNWRREHAH